MGFSLKSLGNTVAKVAGGALGFSFSGGNPAGAVLGSNLANTVLGAVGLSDDQVATAENLSAQKELAGYKAARQNELNEAAFQRNLQQWNLENEYNSPEAQMQRYINAGLNPNLIYDQQNVSASSPELKPATYDPGDYNPVDRSALRQQLQLALLEHAQRVENQAIQNDLARQELALRIKASEREDEKLDLLKSRMISLIGSTDDDIQRVYDRDYDMRVKQWKLAEQAHKSKGGLWKTVKRQIGLEYDPWYDENPMPLRDVTGKEKLKYYGRRAQ